MTTIFPLIDFPFRGEAELIAPQITISRPNLADIGTDFPEMEAAATRAHFRREEPCLIIDSPAVLPVPPEEIGRIFLFALWVQRPTKTSFAWRVQRKNGRWVPFRQMDRFMYNEAAVEDELSDDDLLAVKNWFAQAAAIRTRRGRLNTALVLSIRACEAHFWQVGLICCAAALEAILTDGTREESTERLALSFAHLVAHNQKDRNKQHGIFRSVYRHRSDLLHGRGYNHKNPGRNLRKLARAQEALRRLWQRVLREPQFCIDLDKDDTFRKALFDRILADES